VDPTIDSLIPKNPKSCNEGAPMNRENVKHQIKELLEKYNRTVEEKRTSNYDEANTKKDFITPLFRALGWDVENRYTPDEVTNEYPASKGRVDYAFRIKGLPKFFLEAKALREKDLNNPKFIGQAIDYAWSKSCTWAVLSDFKSVIIFNAEWKTDDLLQNRFLEIPCVEFLDRFEELWLLSKESFERGMIDKEAEKWGKKAKLAPIDQYLLDDFARWRNLLSKNILKYNSDMKLTEEELDETVQKLLNRLVFIRKAEDAELEERVLESALRGWESEGKKALYVHLGEIFKKFNEIYDSELFEEAIVDQVVITNDVLKEVITGLYKPADKLRRYDFSIIDADVLGNVYEQYLGHILKKTKKRAEVKESRARRKEEGIYYTPTYIVDYIVRNTLDELLKDKKVDVEKTRVLDPACGSGSFLIKAFDVLNMHYSKHDKDYAQTQLDTTGQGTTFTKKVEILQKNIFGVDLDKQAVEIARLNLLLKIAEKGQRLPLLKQNIKNGNSLIDDEKVAEDKAFKWEKEFKQIIDEGGFDVVIGNPPYVESRDIPDEEWNLFRENYTSAYKRFDLSVLFIEKAIRLLKEEGLLGVIISNKFTASDYGFGLRKFILDNCSIKQILDVSHMDVFKDASTYPYIVILQKESNKSKRKNNIIIVKKVMDENKLREDDAVYQIKQSFFHETPNLVFSIDVTAETTSILEKISSSSVALKEICEMKDGIHTGNVRDKLILDNKINKNCKKLITAESINRYSLKWNNLWVNYDATVIDRKKGEYGSLRDPRIFEAPQKLITALFGLRPEVAYDNERFYANNSIKIILPRNENINLKYIMAILNSNLINFYYRTFFASTHVRGGYIQFYPQDFLKLPIKQASKSEQQSIITYVDKMLSLNKRLNEIGDKKTDERQRVEREINNTDAEIDKLVYDLYNITKEEKKIIEESLK